MELNQADIVKAVQAILAGQAVKKQAKPKPRKGKKAGRKPLTDAEKAVFMARNDADCVAEFAKRGFKVVPRETALTYGKWAEKGRIVKKGEKAVRVGPFNLFAYEQTEPAPAVIGA